MIPEQGFNKYLKDGKVVDLEDYDSSHSVYELGWGANGIVGYAFANGTRAEAEFSYLTARMSTFSGTDTKDYQTKPSVAVLSFMVNGLYEFDTGIPLRPFLGLGIGASHATESDGKPKSPPDEFQELVGSGFGVSYSARAGVSYEVVDGLAILLGYRIYSYGLPFLTYERKLDKNDPDYDKYDTQISGNFGFRMNLVHRVELGVSYRL